MALAPCINKAFSSSAPTPRCREGERWRRYSSLNHGIGESLRSGGLTWGSGLPEKMRAVAVGGSCGGCGGGGMNPLPNGGGIMPL